ncbi:mucin-associated surface protein [Marisediminicola antarctica]|uniref:Mucin-associated surface protein n=1 Tax=Marisediminicola antarctica TaxID=674079 RepID=A0A7L5AI16_9MICO|nr:mucin-associated surface protein [Marisediminicola antarctica]QHO69682.1 hypothetical protein BHD05_08540 [Marisediminicola antarctica]
MIRAATARTASARTATVLAATMLAVTLLLAGCASPAAYSEETAQDLQERVLAVTDAAASADYAAAQVRIDELRVAANDALARGELSEERHAAIVSALDLVESDIDAALAAEAAAAEAAAQAAEAEEAARFAEEQRLADEAAAAEDQRLADEAAAAEEAARLAEEKAKEQEKQDGEGKPGKNDND